LPGFGFHLFKRPLPSDSHPSIDLSSPTKKWLKASIHAGFKAICFGMCPSDL
jgi:hypothetical protein